MQCVDAQCSYGWVYSAKSGGEGGEGGCPEGKTKPLASGVT
jgi:hypothetical protein